MSEWYYAHESQQLGPVSASELQHLISSGALDAKTCLVWKEGMADWQAAATIPEVMPPPPDAAPTMAGTPQLGADPTFAAPVPGSLSMAQPSPGLPGYGPVRILRCSRNRARQSAPRYRGLHFPGF